MKGNGSQKTYLQRRHGANRRHKKRRARERERVVLALRPIMSISDVCKTPSRPIEIIHVCICVCVLVLIMAEYWPFHYFTNIVHYYYAHHLCHLIPQVIYYVVGFGMSFISLVLPTSATTLLCPFASKMLLCFTTGESPVTKSQQPYHYRAIFDRFTATIILNIV